MKRDIALYYSTDCLGCVDLVSLKVYIHQKLAPYASCFLKHMYELIDYGDYGFMHAHMSTQWLYVYKIYTYI